MAQVDKGTFERLRAQAAEAAGFGPHAGAAGERGLRETARSRRVRGALTSALRLDEVPRGMLVAVAVLMLVAVVLGALLAARVAGGGGELLVRGDSAHDETAAASSPDVSDASGDAPDTSDADAGDDDGGGAAPVAALRVHVAGAVVAPGVYDLPEGARVIDAVAAAGGVAEGADADALNLAAPLADGAKVRVPFVGEDAVAESAASTVGGADAAQTTGLVNVNTADVVELQRLPGVGEATAAAIVAEREAGGPFASVDDLVRVDGIGEKKLAKMRALATV